jgi:hypothetical protein
MTRKKISKPILLGLITVAMLCNWSCKDKIVDVPIKNPREYTWTIDTLAYPGSFQTSMTDVWASSPNDVYVVGWNDRGYGVMWHYDGTKWSDVRLHVSQGGNIEGAIKLQSIVGLNSRDIYAVGRRLYDNYHPPPNSLDSSLLIHYDGFQWREVQIQKGALVRSISATAPNNVWACGRNGFVCHYDGTLWKRDSVQLSVPAGGDYYLWDIKANPRSDEVYLLGYIHENDLAKTTRYFFIRSNGRWNLVDTMVYEPGNSVEKFGEDGLWVSPEGTLYSYGGKIFCWTGSCWLTILSTWVSLGKMAGTSEHNFFAVGDFGTAWHSNGIDWYKFQEIFFTDLIYSSVWTDGREVFVVGFTIDYPQKTVILHGR